LKRLNNKINGGSVKKIFWIYLIVLLMVGLFGCGKPKVAAEVNGEKIYTEEVDKVFEDLKSRYGGFFEGVEGKKFEKEIYREVLEGFIESKLIDQQSEELGIEVTDEEIEETMEKFKRLFGTEEAFKERLGSFGWTEKDYREYTRRDLLAKKAKEKIVATAKVTIQEVREFYEAAKEIRFKKPARVRLRRVEMSKKKTAEKFYELLEAGESFDAAVKELSVTTSSVEWRTQEELGEKLFKTAFSLKKGEYSQPLEENKKWYILLLLDKEKESYVPFSEVKESLKSEYLAKKQEEVWEDWLENLKKKAKIKRYLKV
jgi:parvulin-like peptidyl-prolyl isomerase